MLVLIVPSRRWLEVQPLRQLASLAPELSAAALVPRFVASALAEWRRLRSDGAVGAVAAEPPSAQQLQPLVDLVVPRREL